MDNKKRKFLKPMEFAIAALLSVSIPVTTEAAQGNEKQVNTSATVGASIQANQPRHKQLLIKPSNQNKNAQVASHYSHYSHRSHSSHYSHYSSSR